MAFDRVAAQIASLSEHAANVLAGRVLRRMAARHRASDVVAFMIVLTHVLRAKGAAVVPIARLADEAGLTTRALMSALSALERVGVALVLRVDKDNVRMTLPGLIGEPPPPEQPMASEIRRLH